MDQSQALLTSLVLQSDVDGVRTYKVEFVAAGKRYGMSVESDDEELELRPDGALEPCFAVYGTLDEEALAEADEDTRWRWIVGALADEIVENLAESGLLAGWTLAEEDDEDDEGDD